MFTNLRNRLIVILILVVGSGFFLWNNKRKTTTPTQQGSIVNLGLDLQGGMHLGLELDQSQRASADPAKDIELALTVLRKRIDEFGVLEPLIQKVGNDRIVVELPGLQEPERAKEIVKRNAFLEFRISDKSQALEKSMPAMDRALRDLGVTASVAGAAGKPTAVQQLLAGDTTKKAESDSTVISNGIFASLIEQAGVAGVQPMPGEYAVKEGAWKRVDSLLRLAEVRRLWPRNIEFKWAFQPITVGVEQYRLLYALDEKPIITGASLVNATAQVDPLTNGSEVNFELDRPGGRKFGTETGRHVGDYMAILLDGEVQGRPVIQSRIDRQGRIQLGGRSLQEAQDLALTLRAGALPTPLKIVEERLVGPSLGKDSINDGLIAFAVGTALVILIMVGYYHGAGGVAVGALVLYTLLTFGVLSIFEATLTLPGLAGFILSIGIAVDANVLIFERMREEVDHGKSLRLVVDEGFRHAMPAIIDSNIATVLTALFLFQFGTGPVKGFAVTLIVGIFASMITAIFAVRTYFMWWLKRNGEEAKLSLGTFRWLKEAAYDFIGVRKRAYGVTAAVMLIGLGFFAIRGISYSVEFLGGTLLHIKAPTTMTDDQLRAGLDAQGLQGAEIQSYGAPGEFVIRTRLGATAVADSNNTDAATSTVSKALDQVVGAGQYQVIRAESVGPKVGGELRTQAFLAIFLSFFAVLAYLAYRFEWRFGLAAVVATAHDVLMTIAFVAVMKLEVSLVVVAAFLTMVGYSLNDTIIIFDRVRENLHRQKNDSFATILNHSINQTLPRSILTHGTTLSTLLALAIFGGGVIRPFALVMFFGVFTGTFSSIFIASPVLMWIEKRWPPKVGAGLATARSTGRTAPSGGSKRPQPVA